jgi:hypothetical protein
MILNVKVILKIYWLNLTAICLTFLHELWDTVQASNTQFLTTKCIEYPLSLTYMHICAYFTHAHILILRWIYVLNGVYQNHSVHVSCRVMYWHSNWHVSHTQKLWTIPDNKSKRLRQNKLKRRNEGTTYNAAWLGLTGNRSNNIHSNPRHQARCLLIYKDIVKVKDGLLRQEWRVILKNMTWGKFRHTYTHTHAHTE